MALVRGTKGNDSGNKRLVGTNKADQIYGLDGDDELHGRWSNDLLDGGNGNDKLWGDAGNDILTGGKGNDQFNFAWQMGNDIIIDYVNNTSEADSIHLFDLYADSRCYATNWHWLDSRDVNGDGKADAILSLYSNDWIQAQGDGYVWDYNKDTVAVLGWGGRENAIQIQYHPSNGDPSLGYFFG